MSLNDKYFFVWFSFGGVLAVVMSSHSTQGNVNQVFLLVAENSSPRVIGCGNLKHDLTGLVGESLIFDLIGGRESLPLDLTGG